MIDLLNSRLLRAAGLLLCAVAWMANDNNPPNAHTGAPFDLNCNECHGGSNPGGYNAGIAINGLPSTIAPNTSYPLTFTVTPTAGNPVKAGFQLVAVAGDNTNAGTLTAGNSQSGTNTAGGRTYLEHRGGKTFAGNPVTWTFNWTSPATASGNTVKFYYITLLANNNGGTSGDHPVNASVSVPFAGTPPLSATATGTNISCNGGSNGTATVAPVGGTAPYTYHWSNGQTVQTATNLVAGTYTVTVTATSGGTVTASAVLTQPTAISLTASVAGTITCAQPTTTVSAAATGGTAAFTYAWSNGQNGSSMIVSAAGMYTVTATDGNGCTKTANATVSVNNTPPNATANAGPPITCVTSTSQLSGGSTTSGATYAWTGPGGFISSMQNPVVSVPGTYTLVVHAPNGCTTAAFATVIQNTNLPGAAATGGELTCADTVVVLLASTVGAQPAFAWSGPGGNSNQQNFPVQMPGNYSLTVTDGANGCTSTATALVTVNANLPVANAVVSSSLNCHNFSVEINGLGSSQGSNFVYNWTTTNGHIVSGAQTLTPVVDSAGSYHLVVKDTLNGCKASTNLSVNQTLLPIATPVNISNISCNGGSNGSAAVLPGGGNGSYAFVWTNGSTTDTISNLVAGDYGVTVSDGDNCTASATVSISQPTPLEVIATATGQTANGVNNGTATAAPAGGTAPYAFNWSNGQNTATISGLAPGSYAVTVTDSHGCQMVQTVTVNNYNCNLTSNISGNNVTCHGAANGSAAVIVTGAANPITYNWSNGATTPSVTGLTPGAYTVQIADGNGCPATLNISITEPPALTSHIAATNVSCPQDTSGLATIASAGGISPYTFLWNTGAVTASIQNLAAGTYSATVTDQNGCTVAESVSILSIDTISPVLTCPANLVQCGAGILALPEPTVSDNCSSNLVPALVSGLPAGGYFPEGVANLVYRATDAAGNTSTCSFTVSVFSAPQLSTIMIIPDVVGTGQGGISVIVSGGTPPFVYNWTKDGTYFSNVQNLTGLFEGTYVLTVTDAHGCSLVSPPIIVQKLVADQEAQNPYSVRIIPNPVAGRFNLEIKGVQPEAASIFDLNGRLLREMAAEEWQNGVNVEGLSRGLYFLQLRILNGNPITLKWIKTE